MTLPTVLPTAYGTTATDATNAFLKTKLDRSGAVRIYSGATPVPSGTAATTIVGLIPFNKGFRAHLDDKSVYVDDIGAGTTTVSLGYVYNDNTNNTNAATAWVSASTAIQAGGFLTVATKAGLTFDATADGWIVATINTAATDADGFITFQITGAYDGLGVNNQNNQTA